MLTLEALRVAATTPRPWDELDRLVRAELADGSRTERIREYLLANWDLVRETALYNDDSEEAIHDIIDALAGICPAKYAYRNPSQGSQPYVNNLARMN